MDSAAASVGHARKHASKDESVQKQLEDMARGDMSAEASSLVRRIVSKQGEWVDSICAGRPMPS